MSNNIETYNKEKKSFIYKLILPLNIIWNDPFLKGLFIGMLVLIVFMIGLAFSLR